jgi:hypothetical protein
MRRVILLIIAVSLLAFGCLEEKTYPGTKAEQLAGTQSIDLDEDGLTDYQIYDYSATSIADGGFVISRQVTVAAHTTASYDYINDSITDLDLMVAGESLKEFSTSSTESENDCGNNIGLGSKTSCINVFSCSELCSASSVRCKKLVSAYDEMVGGSMLSVLQDYNELGALIRDANKKVTNLRGAPQQDADEFLQKTRDIVYRVASINANPLYASGEMGLCVRSDYDISYVVAAASKIGGYTAANSQYRYRVMIFAKPVSQNTSQPGMEVGGISLSDRIPRIAVANPDSISSVQSIAVSQDSSSVLVSWASSKASKDGYGLVYEFTSDQPPDIVLAGLKSPELKVKRINLAGLLPTNILYEQLLQFLKNYYVSLGLAVGLTFVGLLVIYNVFILVFTLLTEKAGGSSFLAGFRRAFGRTDVGWRTDIILAVLFLGAGFYLSSYMAPAPATAPTLMESADFLIKNGEGLLGVGLMAIGIVMAYFAADNLVKITILERAYGMVIKQEKDMFLAKAGTLNDKLAQLAALVEAQAKEGFDVSREYDLLSSLKSGDVAALTKEMTGKTKAQLEDYLGKVESAVSGLNEKKRMADENWPKWKESIGKTLDEQGEIYQTSLVTVPSSLRMWALSRYAREAGAGTVTLDRDVLRRKKVSGDTMVRDMISKGLLKGAIVIKQDRIALAEFAEGSGTLASVLALKLRNYVQSLAKNMGQHEPQSFVSIGEKTVLVLMKGRNMESVLFINKPKFNEAVEQWKANSKALEG